MERRGLTELNKRLPLSPAFVLPVSHPADYEWRFSAQTKRELVARILQHVGVGETIAHLGSPSTYLEGVLWASQLRHVLLERNDAVISALSHATSHPHEICRVDLISDDVPELEAAAAIIDPPWYLNDTFIFLKAAAGATAIGARILLCQPTEATRPGVAEEREKLLEALPLLGYTLLAAEKSIVRYEMPHFELVSLRSSVPKIEIPSDWRTGDLLLLERSGTPQSFPIILVPEAPLSERTFGPVRVKLRRTGGPDLSELVPGDVLDTVSRRDPIRVQVGLWTSGNRVFRLDDVEGIGKLIDFCHNDLMSATFGLDRTLQAAEQLGINADVARRLFSLLLLELQEHLQYGKTRG